MEKIFRRCEDPYVNHNLFYLKNNDGVYEYVVDNKVVGYGIFRNNDYDMIQIYINKEYENNHYGSELFKNMLGLFEQNVYISVKEDNIKMIRIIDNNNCVEIGKNNGIITYVYNPKQI